MKVVGWMFVKVDLGYKLKKKMLPKIIVQNSWFLWSFIFLSYIISYSILCRLLKFTDFNIIDYAYIMINYISIDRVYLIFIIQLIMFVT